MFRRLFGSSKSTEFEQGYAAGYSSTGARYYDGLKDRGRRRETPEPRIRSADNKLKDRDRRTLSAKTHTAQDNFSLAAWMIRTYLNYVSSVTFKATNDNEQVNVAVEDFVANWSKRNNCDTSGKHPLRRLIRLIEGRRLVDGDVFLLKIAGTSDLRGTVQVIEADRVASPHGSNNANSYMPSFTPDNRSSLPNDYDPDKWSNGVRRAKSGRSQAYMLNKRLNDGNLQYERTIRASNVIHHGFFDRIDQVRGISPFTAGLNTLEDLYEGFDYTLGKIKLASVFGAAIVRDADMGLPGAKQQTSQQDSWQLDLQGGMKLFDIDQGEDVKIIESNGVIPAETLDYMRMMVLLTMKSLDLPMSFFAEDFTNWYGSRGAMIQFKKAIKPKQADLTENLNELMEWRLEMAIADGDLVLPGGMAFDDLKWEWINEGIEWWDPMKEVNGYKAAIAAGLDNPQRICTMLGLDFDENMRLNKEAMQKAEAAGMLLDFSITSSSSRNLDLERQYEHDEEVAEQQAAEQEANEPVEDDTEQTEDDSDGDNLE